jgi:hypothetical protein
MEAVVTTTEVGMAVEESLPHPAIMITDLAAVLLTSA